MHNEPHQEKSRPKRKPFFFRSIWIFLALLLLAILAIGNIFLFATRLKPPTTSVPIPSTKTPTICAQVVTLAKNPKTGKCMQFGSPCDVPTGWIIGNCPQGSSSSGQ